MDTIEKLKKDMSRRRYSNRTISTYVYCIKTFLNSIKKQINKINKTDVVDYLNKLSDKGCSGSTININLQAIKYLMENVMYKRKVYYDIKYSKTPKKLPVVLSKDEFIRIIKEIKNDKHRLMIKLMYSSGLRVSELVNLRVKDFDLENGFGYVRKGKGNKDRIFIIANIIKEELRDFIDKNKLSDDGWLFNGNNGYHYSQKSVYIIVKKAGKKAKINKKVHPHVLRHSFATHLIEDSYDVATVQALLGHKSPETTMVYLHVARPNMINVRSPLDGLLLNNKDEKLKDQSKNLRDISLISEENKRVD